MTRQSQRLAKNVKDARAAIPGLTQEELARRAGVAARTISRLEQGGTTHPRPDEFERIATALGTTTDALMGIDGEPASVAEDGEPPDDQLDAEIEERMSRTEVMLAFMARVRDPKKMSRRAKLVILEDLRKLDGSTRRPS